MNAVPEDIALVPQHQLRCSEVINNWATRNIFLEAAITLCNIPPFSYYEHLLNRFWHILELIIAHDRHFLEQLLAGLHELLARDDDTLPALVIANGGNPEVAHRRRTHQYDEEERGGKNAHLASTAYNKFLFTLVSYVLYKIPPPTPVPASPSSSSSPTPTPPQPSPLANTAIEIAVLAVKNALIQHRQPFAVKQHASVQTAILQHLMMQQQQKQLPDQPPRTPPQFLSELPPNSLKEAVDLLRQIWDNPQFGVLLRENRSLDNSIMLLLMEGSFMLDLPHNITESVALFFANCVPHIQPIKDSLLRPLADKLTRAAQACRREKHATGAFSYDQLCTLIQVC